MVVKYDRVTGLGTLVVSKHEMEFLQEGLEVLVSEYMGIMSKADEEQVCEMITDFPS